MISVLCRNVNPRREYTFNTVFAEWLGVPYRIITDARDFDASSEILISYEMEDKRGLRIEASGLLSENTIRNFRPNVSFEEGIPLLFPDVSPENDLSFDVFSAVFWMLSRYEEYLPFQEDEHGRFEADQSFIYSLKKHRWPLVDMWLYMLRECLIKKFPKAAFPSGSFSFLPTYDIDQAWSFLHKGVWRNTAGLLRDLFKGKLKEADLRMRVLRKTVPDPFYSFRYQFSLHDLYNLKPVYFIHPGTYGRFDKNIPLSHPAMKALFRELATRYQVGLHPSYLSADSRELLEKEIELFVNTTGKLPVRCRQHFLRIKIPETYRIYSDLGIKEDHSLGFASDSGFRAGTCRPFLFFDLERDHVTGLIIQPFALMDGAYKIYRQQNPQESIEEAIEMIILLEKMKARMVTLWHNESLGDSPAWKDWRRVYESIVKTAVTHGDFLSST